MTFVVLFILAVVWALYLASWLRSRALGRRSSNSIASFNKHLSVLERARPAGVDAPPALVGAPRKGSILPPVLPASRGRNQATELAALSQPHTLGPRPMTLADARKRRRDVITALAGFAVFTLAIALLVGGPALYLHLVADALLLGYVGMLAYTQRLAHERQEKVHYLHADDERVPEPALLLQRSAN